MHRQRILLLRFDVAAQERDGVELVAADASGRGISCRPSFESKRHFPFFSTIGTGSGQSTVPHDHDGPFRVGDVVGHFHLLARLLGEPGQIVLVFDGIAGRQIPLPSAPKMASTAAMSPAAAALTRASAACWGVSKVRCVEGGLAARAGIAHRQAHAIAASPGASKHGTDAFLLSIHFVLLALPPPPAAATASHAPAHVDSTSRA